MPDEHQATGGRVAEVLHNPLQQGSPFNHQWIVEGEVFVLLIQKRPKDHVRRAILSY